MIPVANSLSVLETAAVMTNAAVFGRETGMEARKSRATGRYHFWVGGGMVLADGVGWRGFEWG